MSQFDSSRYRLIEQERGIPNRSIGFGKPLPNAERGNASALDARRKAFVGMAKMGWKQCPTYNLPNIDAVTLHYDGPLTTLAVQQTYGTTINPLGVNLNSPPPLCSAVESSFAESGNFQPFAFVCAIQWMIDVEPTVFTAKVNSLVAPTTPVSKPVSPDMFSVMPADIATAGALGLTSAGGQSTSGNFLPGFLNWGIWQEMFAYYMARAYTLNWQVGHSQFISNEPLRYTAFVPSNAQDGSASNSEAEVLFALRPTHAHYPRGPQTSP